MDVLATRALSYLDDKGTEKEIVLTLFMPFEAEGDWKGRFAFDPPILQLDLDPPGGDFLDVFVRCLSMAFILVKSSDLYGQVHWRGMLDCGLPKFTNERVAWGSVDIPLPECSAGDMAVLTTRRLGYPDESGGHRELLLTVFVPFEKGERWKCGITFGPPLSSGVYYGVGEDLIEALLDAIAMARAIYERHVPMGCASGKLRSCSGFPHKIGRSFLNDPYPDMPGMLDRSAE